MATAWNRADGDAAIRRSGSYGLMLPGRTELKYSVPGEISGAALDMARRFLAPDAMALAPRQRVTSLYLDTPQLTFLRWHRERAADRFKLRIRRYGDYATPLLYAEVKRKTGSITRKHRAAFPAEALPAVLEGPGLTEIDEGVAHVLEEFVVRRSQANATPRVLVTCMRESLRDPSDAAAVTVDRDLRHQPTSRGDLIGDAGAWHSLALPNAFAGASALVEMKYTGAAPGWMEALMERLAPWRVAFSKYAAAMGERHSPASC